MHIATEGPLGLAARAYCMRTGRPYTTAYHTQFPEYVHARTRLPLGISYRWMRWFHAPSRCLMVATEHIRRRLADRGFGNLAMWTRGVDTMLFKPGPRPASEVKRPDIPLRGARRRREKPRSIPVARPPGTKWVVGDGPARADLQRSFPSAVFFGMRTGESLAWHYRQADVFVFPSRTDTFGLVMLEAMASRDARRRVPRCGPIDVVRHGTSGILDQDLRRAALAALDLPRDDVRAHAEQSSWQRATAQFIANLHPAHA